MEAREFLNYLLSMKISISEIKEVVIENAIRSICWEQRNSQDYFLYAEFAENTAVYAAFVGVGISLSVTYQSAENFRISVEKLKFGDIFEREIIPADSDEPQEWLVEKVNGVEVSRTELHVA